MPWFRPTTVLPILALSLASLAMASAVRATDAPLQPFQAEYEVLRNDKAIGSSRISLERDGAHWVYRSNTTGDRGMARLAGLEVEQRTQFDWLDGQPRPSLSSYRQTATMGSRSADVRYDWPGGSYLLTDRKGEHRHALVPGAVDRYGSGIAVAAQLATGATDFTLKVAHADGLRDWRFRVTGREQVSTAAGRFDALRVERVRDGDDDDRSTVTWHAAERGYVAVRMRQVEDGNTIETRLRRFDPR